MNDKVKFLKDHPIFWSRIGGVWAPALRTPDGEPYFDFNYNLGIKEYQRFHRDFKSAGVKVYSALLDLGWVGVDTYDYSFADLTLERVFEADPDGYFFPRIKLDVPVEWCNKYPEEVFVYNSGRDLSLDDIIELIGSPKQPFWHVKVPEWYPNAEEYAKPTTPVINLQSISSKQWLKDGCEALRRLIEHIENGKYGDRIVGYHLGFGNCGETQLWHTPDYRNHGDYGIANLRNFYDFGLKIYGNEDKLKEAWLQPELTRDNVILPSAEERYGNANTLNAYFRGEDKDVICRDYDMFLSDSVASAVEKFSATAKKFTDKPVGWFYGYFLFVGDVHGEGGLAYDRILNCPDVDFLASPAAYYYRGGNSPSVESAAAQSINLKKLYFEEIDTRTYIVSPERGELPRSECTRSFEETRYVLWRSLCKNLSYGSAFWWMDLGSGWFDAPDIMAEMGKLTKAHSILKEVNHKSASDVLVVVDDESILNTRYNRFWTHRFVRDVVLKTRTMGAICDMYRTSDLDGMDLSQYKLVIFAINYTLTPEKLASLGIPDDATVMFNNVVGIVKDGKPSLKNVEMLTGFALREDYDEEFMCPVIKIVGEDNELTAAKVVNGRRVVMNADPRITPAKLRQIAKDAGCHVYIDNDIILFGDEGMLGVFSKGETHGEFKLKRKCKCRDHISGKEFEGDVIPVDFKEHGFMVLQMED